MATQELTLEMIRNDLTTFRKQLLLEKKNSVKSIKGPEPSTSGFIQELLGKLGYSLSDSSLVREYAVESLDAKREYCDLALLGSGRKRGKPDVLIEVKPVVSNIENKKHLNQLLGYLVRSSIKWGILTNGLQWKGYFMQHGGKLMPIFDLDMTEGIDGAHVSVFRALEREGLVFHLKLLREKRKVFTAENVAAFMLDDKPVSYLVAMMWEKYGVELYYEEMRAMLRNEVIGGKVAVDEKTVCLKSVKSELSKKAEEKPISKATEGILFTLKGIDAEVKGRREGDGFLVFKGAKVRDPVPSFEFRCRSSRKVRNALVDSGAISNGELQCDHLFNSPSSAASVILGRSSNGRIQWVAEDGRTYGEVYND